MTREDYDKLTPEAQEELLASLLQLHEIWTAPKVTKCKCKPTYNFQSIEFEWDLTEDNYTEMIALYDRIAQDLKEIAPSQPDESKGPKATDKQKALLDRLKVKYDKNITAAEASKLIDKQFGK